MTPPQFAHLAAAGCARRHQAFEAPAWPGGQRDHLSRRRVSAGSLHQFSVPAGMVAKERSGAADRWQELQELFSLEGINRANAVVNFKEPATTPEETFDPKAVWLNAEHIRGSADRGFERAPAARSCAKPASRSRRKKCCGSRR